MVDQKRAPSSGFDPLAAYRRMFATADDGMAAWWYLGTAFADMAGFPLIPVIQAETLMIYKTITLDADSFRMDWWEIGYLRDVATGEIAKAWTNPITGQTVATPQKFEEGPAHFLIRRDGDGLALELTQAHARIESVKVVFTEDSGRIMLEQTERKVRGFPLPDGTMPSLDSPNVSPAVTVLSLFSDRQALAGPHAASSGAYSFELRTPPGWMGFGARPGRAITRGAMVKASMQTPLNPIAYGRLQALFPDRFDGDEVRPQWPAQG